MTGDGAGEHRDAWGSRRGGGLCGPLAQPVRRRTAGSRPPGGAAIWHIEQTYAQPARQPTCMPPTLVVDPDSLPLCVSGRLPFPTNRHQPSSIHTPTRTPLTPSIHVSPASDRSPSLAPSPASSSPIRYKPPVSCPTHHEPVCLGPLVLPCPKPRLVITYETRPKTLSRAEMKVMSSPPDASTRMPLRQFLRCEPASVWMVWMDGWIGGR